jgi:cytochrome b
VLHVRCAARLTLPELEHSIALSSAIQGAGLAVALVMAATGTIGYFAWTEGSAMTGLAGVVFDIHGTLANVMWGYLVVHVGAALAHELLGHRILYQMSPMRQVPTQARSSGALAGVEDASGLRE